MFHYQQMPFGDQFIFGSPNHSVTEILTRSPKLLHSSIPTIVYQTLSASKIYTAILSRTWMRSHWHKSEAAARLICFRYTSCVDIEEPLNSTGRILSTFTMRLRELTAAILGNTCTSTRRVPSLFQKPLLLLCPFLVDQLQRNSTDYFAIITNSKCVWSRNSKCCMHYPRIVNYTVSINNYNFLLKSMDLRNGTWQAA